QRPTPALGPESRLGTHGTRASRRDRSGLITARPLIETGLALLPFGGFGLHRISSPTPAPLVAGWLSDRLSRLRTMNKGTFSNILSAIVLAVGWLLASREVMGGDLLLEAGLFAFSGGITNALAVKMLFDRIAGL